MARKIFSLETKRLVQSLFDEMKKYREIEQLSGVPQDILRLWKAKSLLSSDWIATEERQSPLSTIEREEIVKLHGQGLSCTMLAIQFGVYRGTIKSVITQSRKNEISKRAISQAFASSIATQVIEGKFRSSLKAAEFYGLEPRSVQRWVKSELKNRKGRAIVGDSSRSGDEHMRYSITSVLAYTFAIKEWITKNFNLKDHSESNIVSIVESLKGKGVPIKEACSWLGIHRSTFYRKRQKQLRAEEDDPLVTQISELQKRRNFAYGAKRMAVYLSKLNGFAINHKRVARLMRLHGLNSRVRPKRRIHYKTELLEPVQEPLYNVLKRDFSSSGPMIKLVTDMTFVPVREGWVVLSTIKDLFNHKIVARETGSSATLQLALATLNKLPTKEGLLPSDCVIHSDRGGTYTSMSYVKAVRKLGARPSYSRRGNCLDNASMETFYGHMKSETFRRMTPQERIELTRAKAQEIIDDYITWYNTERIQSSLGYVSPEEFKGSM